MEFTVTSFEIAETLLLEFPHTFDAVLSINDPHDFPPRGFEEFSGPRLLLEFNDLENVKDGSDIPQRVHVERILQFGSSLPRTSRLLVHCTAGVSRSTAAAFILVTSERGPGSERESLQHVRAIRPCAFPNSKMVEFGDSLLGRDGALLGAYRAELPSMMRSMLERYDALVG